MGDICRMRDTARANAVLHQDREFDGWLKKLEGQTVTIESVDYGPGETIGTLVAELTLRLADGTTETVEGPTLREVTEDGVCGYGLEFEYEEDELRRMIQVAADHPDNGLDDHDRDALREELERLHEFYE